MMRVSSTASAKRSGSLANPGASNEITAGVKISATTSRTTWLAKSKREHAIGEQLGGIGAALLADARIGRHEGGVEGALGEDRAEMIRQPQRDEERIRDRSGAEHGGQHDVARKAGEPREQRQAADGEDASNHWPRPLS